MLLLFGYPSKYWNYTSKKQFGWFTHPPPLQWIPFLPFVSQKILLNTKDVEFDFRMGCILVLFSFLWIINVQCTNFGFLNFLFSKLAILVYFDTKLPFLSLKFLKTTFSCKILDEITLTHAGWAWKLQKFIFCHFWEFKFIAYTHIQIHVTGSIFIVNWFLLNICKDVLYQNL